ncbi:Phosphoribosylformylglycinamidine cyclo-ligase [bacterium HR17]|uniref:Phosphoribosylformylglycinamidine cyclo-ligase n=1 Tax=Candidatus Fervidibacter japonicus TaxID=2035412 RepID=A0A2H5XFK2_9BACT|nr:Phosphoribosylformylglycinamidine cyclo-ligase [bacterium HR17]
MSDGLTYETAGVNVRDEPTALRRLAEVLRPTENFLPKGKVVLGIGYFAAVVQVSDDLGIAVATDGVGTKLLVAQMLERYDTVGVDCVAMNANDVLCVGATPAIFVDYLAVERLDPEVIAQIAHGLQEGARQAGVAVVGGELAQVREIVRGIEDGKGFDLVGTCVGFVHPRRLVIGSDLQVGDVVIGLPSNGIHSNGLTLARRILFDRARFTPTTFVDELNATVGDELLKPTRIYVRAVAAVLAQGRVKALVHITGGGVRNLLRVQTPCTFVLDDLPEPPPIFQLLQRLGDVPDAEMFTTFNMGVGFCLIVAKEDADRTVRLLQAAGEQARVIGHIATLGERQVRLPQYRLVIAP